MTGSSPAECGRGVALARTALAGNPSDGFGGAVLATTFANFDAAVTAQRAPALLVEPASRLVELTARRFAKALDGAATSCALRWRNDVPREVGLGSSSALVIATLRALADLHAVDLPQAELASLAHTIERSDLGVPGGHQDQVVQSHGSLVLMEFGERPQVEPLAAELLPPLLIAYRRDTAEHSGVVHAPLRARYHAREPELLPVLDELADLARAARGALLAGDRAGFAQAVDQTFDSRVRIMDLQPGHVAMVQAARACGAAANYSGSGGAVVCVCEDERHRRDCARALRALGCHTLVPRLAH